MDLLQIGIWISGVSTMILGCTALWAMNSSNASLARFVRPSSRKSDVILAAIARGDLSVSLDDLGNQDHLVATLASIRQTMRNAISDVRLGAGEIVSASADISKGNQNLSEQTEQAANALEKTVASMEQLTSNVAQNVENAHQANQLAIVASSMAARGGTVVGQVVETMNEINSSSREISDIVSVIDDIAFQTNILALNAAVEAARAGEQGRGFAVVASEVRSLAGRSAEAAKKIKILIDTSVERVEQGTALVGQAGLTMSEVVGSIRRVTDMMSEISSAASAQIQGISQVSDAVIQLDQITQHNAALVEQMSAAGASLHEQAEGLTQAVSAFTFGAQPVSSLARPAP